MRAFEKYAAAKRVLKLLQKEAPGGVNPTEMNLRKLELDRLNQVSKGEIYRSPDLEKALSAPDMADALANPTRGQIIALKKFLQTPERVGAKNLGSHRPDNALGIDEFQVGTPTWEKMRDARGAQLKKTKEYRSPPPELEQVSEGILGTPNSPLNRARGFIGDSYNQGKNALETIVDLLKQLRGK